MIQPKLDGNRQTRRRHARQKRLYIKHEAKRAALGLEKCALCKKKIRKHPNEQPCEFTIEVKGKKIEIAGSVEHLRQTIETAYAV